MESLTMNGATSFALAALLVGAAASFVSCSRDSDGDHQNDTGMVTVALVIPSGAAINSVAFTITGPGSFSRTGTIDVSHSSTISASVGSIPAGGPYTVNLTATATDGQTTCGGMQTFNIAAGMTTPVTVHVLCHEPARTGSVLVTGGVNVCPVIDGISSSPSEVVVGSSIALAAAAHDADSAPAALTYAWTAPSGSFASAVGQTTSFTCTQAGTVSISLTVSDGDSSPGCPHTHAVPVICTSSQSP